MIPGQALNQRVPNRNDLPIIVGYDPIQPELFQVLSIREVYHGSDDIITSGLIPNVGPHHTTHEWSGDGDDTVYVHLRQFLPLLVRPTSGMEVQIDQGIIYRGGWIAVADQTLDLTTYRPTIPSRARYVLISVDADGVATATAGTQATKAALAVTDIPTPDPDHFCCAAVRVYTGQTEIIDYGTDYDIVDLRFPQMDGMRASAANMLKLIGDLENELDMALSRHKLGFGG